MDKMTTVQGDGGLPDKGTTTNVVDAYGADLGLDATNKIKGISGMTQSDMPEEEVVEDENFGSESGEGPWA